MQPVRNRGGGGRRAVPDVARRRSSQRHRHRHRRRLRRRLHPRRRSQRSPSRPEAPAPAGGCTSDSRAAGPGTSRPTGSGRRRCRRCRVPQPPAPITPTSGPAFGAAIATVTVAARSARTNDCSRRRSTTAPFRASGWFRTGRSPVEGAGDVTHGDRATVRVSRARQFGTGCGPPIWRARVPRLGQQLVGSPSGSFAGQTATDVTLRRWTTTTNDFRGDGAVATLDAGVTRTSAVVLEID